MGKWRTWHAGIYLLYAAMLWSSGYNGDNNSELLSGFRAQKDFQQTQAAFALQSWAYVTNFDSQFFP